MQELKSPLGITLSEVLKILGTLFFQIYSTDTVTSLDDKITDTFLSQPFHAMVKTKLDRLNHSLKVGTGTRDDMESLPIRYAGGTFQPMGGHV